VPLPNHSACQIPDSSPPSLHLSVPAGSPWLRLNRPACTDGL
jgi:hypothetical protein